MVYDLKLVVTSTRINRALNQRDARKHNHVEVSVRLSFKIEIMQKDTRKVQTAASVYRICMKQKEKVITLTQLESLTRMK